MLTRPNNVNSRNGCSRVCRDAQRHHVHESISKDDLARVYKFLNSLRVGKSRKDVRAALLHVLNTGHLRQRVGGWRRVIDRHILFVLSESRTSAHARVMARLRGSHRIARNASPVDAHSAHAFTRLCTKRRRHRESRRAFEETRAGRNGLRSLFEFTDSYRDICSVLHSVHFMFRYV